MYKILQINSVVNTGSTGKIAEDIGQKALDHKYKSYIAYGRVARKSASELIKIGNKKSLLYHLAQTRIFDRHGLESKLATKTFIKKIISIQPDIIHLHNIHGYYINYPILFSFLKEYGKPVVWTLHDCWLFTGHCSYFSSNHCNKWLEGCPKCHFKNTYPNSWIFSNSRNNFKKKKEAFSQMPKLVLIPVSDWLAELVRASFLSDYTIQTIHNGINLKNFYFIPNDEEITKKKYHIPSSKKIILGVANIWSKSKGYDDFKELAQIISKTYQIVMVGLSQEQIKEARKTGIIGITRTEDLEALRQLYASSLVFVNPTWDDNFPTTNIEALACGTPVITYKTGGSIEAVDEKTGYIVEQGDIQELYDKIQLIYQNTKERYRTECRKRVIAHFNKDDRYEDYINLYRKLIQS